MGQELNNLGGFKMAGNHNCSVCQDLLACMGRSFDMLDTGASVTKTAHFSEFWAGLSTDHPEKVWLTCF
jgi:hypothetical protein